MFSLNKYYSFIKKVAPRLFGACLLETSVERDNALGFDHVLVSIIRLFALQCESGNSSVNELFLFRDMIKGVWQISLKESPEPKRVSRCHDIIGVNIFKNNLAKGFHSFQAIAFNRLVARIPAGITLRFVNLLDTFRIHPRIHQGPLGRMNGQGIGIETDFLKLSKDHNLVVLEFFVQSILQGNRNSGNGASQITRDQLTLFFRFSFKDFDQMSFLWCAVGSVRFEQKRLNALGLGNSLV